MKKKKLILMGCGSLSSIIANHIQEEMSDHYEILGVIGRDQKIALQFAEGLGAKNYESLDLALKENPDYIIEAASPNVVKEVGIKILEAGVNLIPLSVGAFADEDFYNKARQAALENNSRVHIPAGAVGGFDVLSAAMLMGGGDVEIKTQKSPESLNGAPYLKGRKLPEDKTETVFKGTAKEAIKEFPKNINVAVATALATSGVDNTKVTIESIPGRSGNRHQIKLEGEEIKVGIDIESILSADNPKSSSLAAYSVIALLKNLVEPIVM